MIRIWNVRHKDDVIKGERFYIGWNTVYITLPFRKLYTTVKRDGIGMHRNEKRIWFFIGIWFNQISDTIETKTTYDIEVGYVK